jgi:16S rRNA (guanine(966)-N(2))-methyltransferase RsmD
MRIIGGMWRSRRLIRPAAETTRPMPDRVREAIFSSLGSRFATPGALPPLRVFDLFAGSGSMGLEALSRGAAHCTFVERNRNVASILGRNIDALGAVDAATVLVADAWRVALDGSIGDWPDLVFLDPPYRDAMDVSAQGPVRRFLSRHAGGDRLVLFHHPVGTTFAPEADDAWRIDVDRRFGSNMITMIR